MALVSARRGRVCSGHSSDEMHQHFKGFRKFPKFQKVGRLPTVPAISCPWDRRSRASHQIMSTTVSLVSFTAMLSVT